MKSDPKFTQSFMTFCDNFGENRILSVKQKELIAVGVALYARCEHCLFFTFTKRFRSSAPRKRFWEPVL